MQPTENRRANPLRFSVSLGLFLKLTLLAFVNGATVFAIPRILDEGWWPGLVAVVLGTVAIDFAFLSRRAIPLKYLLPGTLLALAFQVVPVVYSAYISVTNYGAGHVLTQSRAVEALRAQASNVPGTSRFRLNILGADGGNGALAFLLTDEAGATWLGTAEGLTPVTAEEIVTDSSGKVTSVGAYSALGIRQVADRQDEIIRDFKVPAEQGTVRALTLNSAAVYEPVYRYDAATQTLTELATGKAYRPHRGNFVSPEGEVLSPGWVAGVGWDNFTRIVRAKEIRGPFLRVLLWNYAFAVLSVVLTFGLGLLLALALNHPRLRGRRIYRSLLVIPYALPSFMTALVWRGMLNQEFGIINRVLGADVPWLRDPWLAKFSILLVNLWLGFPYMFLITTGALQAIPEQLTEAARVDGANPRQAFRRVTFPLLLIAVAPLLIASFAFNFNNFNIIYLLNGGGPPIEGAQTPAGHTDILISYTYRIAFESGRGADFGFASAISILIFMMVATVSALSFRRTRALEELS